MIFRAFDELVFTLPGVFSSQLRPSDAAKLLAQKSERVVPSADCVVGRIDGINAEFSRHRPFIRNPFAPIFVGDFRKARDGSQLVGEFRRRKIVLLLSGVSYFVLLLAIPFVFIAIPLMAVWLGASLFAGVLAGAFSSLALVGVLFALALLIRLGINAARLDLNLIAEHIENVLRQPG